MQALCPGWVAPRWQGAGRQRACSGLLAAVHSLLHGAMPLHMCIEASACIAACWWAQGWPTWVAPTHLIHIEYRLASLVEVAAKLKVGRGLGAHAGAQDGLVGCMGGKWQRSAPLAVKSACWQGRPGDCQSSVMPAVLQHIHAHPAPGPAARANLPLLAVLWRFMSKASSTPSSSNPRAAGRSQFMSGHRKCTVAKRASASVASGCAVPDGVLTDVALQGSQRHCERPRHKGEDDEGLQTGPHRDDRGFLPAGPRTIQHTTVCGM